MENATPVTAPGAGQGGAGARVLREIIRTPAFLEIIKLHSRDFDPEDARELVRTFLWEDVELSLSIVGNLSEIVNYLAAAVLELGRQMNNFPGGLLDQYVTQLGTEIDVEVLKEYPAVFGPLLENIRFSETASLAVGKAVNAGADFVSSVAASNPYFVRDALAGIDGRAVMRAGFAVARSCALWLVSGISRILGKRGSQRDAR